MGRVRIAVAVAMAAAVVAGCSSSASEEPPEPKTSTDDKSKTADDSGPVAVDGGVAAPESLTDFRCEPNDAGHWSASGTLTNETAQPVDFRVAVVIAPPDTPSATAREITVPDVPSGKSTDFSSKRLRATSGDDATCSVQVAQLR